MRPIVRSALIAGLVTIVAATASPADAAPPPPDRVNQVNGDGYADLVAVDVNGQLVGIHNGSLVNPSGVPYLGSTWRLTSNWTDVVHMAAGDINNDGYSDLVAVKNGELEIYYNGILVNPGGYPYLNRGWRQAGWFNIRHFGVADVTGDRYADLVAVDADQNLIVYVNGFVNSGGTTPFHGGPPDWRLGNWTGTRNLALTDVNRDGYSDIVAVNANGQLVGYNNATLVDPAGRPFTVQTWIIPESNWTNVRHLTAGDVNRDGYGDLIGVRTDDTIDIYNNGSLVNPGGIPYRTRTWNLSLERFRNIA